MWTEQAFVIPFPTISVGFVVVNDPIFAWVNDDFWWAVIVIVRCRIVIAYSDLGLTHGLCFFAELFSFQAGVCGLLFGSGDACFKLRDLVLVFQLCEFALVAIKCACDFFGDIDFWETDLEAAPIVDAISQLRLRKFDCRR